MTLPPIRQQVVVPADNATAFEVFTAHIGRWWPLRELSVHGADSTVSFVDGEIVERAADGERAVWGTVTRWEPGIAVAFTWHPGRSEQQTTHVAVTFDAGGAGTVVTLEHSGWEVFDDPAAARGGYDEGWPMVLGRYHDDIDLAGDDGEETWVALVHRPGPAAPAVGTIFADPRFAEHVAFLTRMREAGYLVAAGPFDDASGEGMTILRLPGADQLQLATRLATEDDASVTGGFFSVTVRPWQVVLHAVPAARASSGAAAH